VIQDAYSEILAAKRQVKSGQPRFTPLVNDMPPLTLDKYVIIFYIHERF
jgi:hypothetical protein